MLKDDQAQEREGLEVEQEEEVNEEKRRLSDLEEKARSEKEGAEAIARDRAGEEAEAKEEKKSL
jgi:hypothetical protein